MPASTSKTPDPDVTEPDGITPAEAAAAEALNDGDIAVEFRNATFVIPESTRASARFAMAVASGQDHKFIYELIGPADSDRFIALCKPGEPFAEVAVEFFTAYGKASGQGNS
jgi:hypothetical protein